MWINVCTQTSMHSNHVISHSEISDSVTFTLTCKVPLLVLGNTMLLFGVYWQVVLLLSNSLSSLLSLLLTEDSMLFLITHTLYTIKLPSHSITSTAPPFQTKLGLNYDNDDVIRNNLTSTSSLSPKLRCVTYPLFDSNV